MVEKGLAQQQAGQLKRAVALYKAHFWSVSYPTSTAFDDWLSLLRERFQQRALLTLDWLAQYESECGVYVQVNDYAQKQTGLMPWREKSHQQAMRFLALSGQRGTALTQFESCRRYLSQELGQALNEADDATALFLATAKRVQLHFLLTAETKA